MLLYGAVSSVGIFPIKPNTRVAEFIIQNGGTTPDADITKIKLIQNNGITEIFNMDRYLYTNEASNNLILENGDKVIVPFLTEGQKLGRLSKDYILQYGNVVNITINETTNSGIAPTTPESYSIDSDGNIYHKLFGKIHIGGMSVEKVEVLLTEMAKKYYRAPLVAIELIKLTSRSVYIFGEIPRAGIYPIEGNIKLAEFLATIGGVAKTADLEEILITRKNGETIVFDFKGYLYKRKDKNNIYLEDGDRIIVQNKNRGFIFDLSERLMPYQIIFRLITSAISLLIIITM